MNKPVLKSKAVEKSLINKWCQFIGCPQGKTKNALTFYEKQSVMG